MIFSGRILSLQMPSDKHTLLLLPVQQLKQGRAVDIFWRQLQFSNIGASNIFADNISVNIQLKLYVDVATAIPAVVVSIVDVVVMVVVVVVVVAWS